MLKPITRLLLAAGLCLAAASPAFAGLQDKYPLPDEYLTLEKSYLKEYPKLQTVMDIMVRETEKQLPKPGNDILHNRVCTVLVYKMAKEDKLPKHDIFVAVTGDLLHNIAKADKAYVLTDPAVLKASDEMMQKLKKGGSFTKAPEFWTNLKIYENPKLGANKGYIHHITGALFTERLLKEAGGAGLSDADMRSLQTSIVEHSTGYWYFRASVNDILGDKSGWKLVYPEPETQLAKYIHDADLVSQFVYNSVVSPEEPADCGASVKKA